MKSTINDLDRYIRPLKLPQMLQVFFIPKKDGKKRIVQDYQYLNS